MVAAKQTVGGGGPEGAIGCLRERPDEVAAQLRGGAPVEECEVNAVEADKAAVRGQPEIAVACLTDGVDGVLGQPVVGLPELLAVLTQRLCRIECVER